jgi:hypothetical protein
LFANKIAFVFRKNVPIVFLPALEKKEGEAKMAMHRYRISENCGKKLSGVFE